MSNLGQSVILSVGFLTRYYTTRTATPFAIHCLVVDVLLIVRFA